MSKKKIDAFKEIFKEVFLPFKEKSWDKETFKRFSLDSSPKMVMITSLIAGASITSNAVPFPPIFIAMAAFGLPAITNAFSFLLNYKSLKNKESVPDSIKKITSAFLACTASTLIIGGAGAVISYNVASNNAKNAIFRTDRAEILTELFNAGITENCTKQEPQIEFNNKSGNGGYTVNIPYKCE